MLLCYCSRTNFDIILLLHSHVFGYIKILCETSALLHSHGFWSHGRINFDTFASFLNYSSLHGFGLIRIKVMLLLFQRSFDDIEKIIVKLWHCFIHITLLHFQFNPFKWIWVHGITVMLLYFLIPCLFHMTIKNMVTWET